MLLGSVFPLPHIPEFGLFFLFFFCGWSLASLFRNRKVTSHQFQVTKILGYFGRLDFAVPFCSATYSDIRVAIPWVPRHVHGDPRPCGPTICHRPIATTKEPGLYFFFLFQKRREELWTLHMTDPFPGPHTNRNPYADRWAHKIYQTHTAAIPPTSYPRKSRLLP